MPVHQDPKFVHPVDNLVPVSDHLANLVDIPPSRMFLIKQSLAAYREKNPGAETYDASQGDGGASLPGTPPEILRRAAELQIEHGTGYDSPFGYAAFREVVIDKYWQATAASGLKPENVVGTAGGRDALIKAYQAMLALGYGRQGDALLVSRVPWISYNWGPYGIGMNIIRAPGDPNEGWAYTPEGIQASVDYAAEFGRKIAGMVITNPDNPTGRTVSVDNQVMLARAALKAGVAFVLFDWIYHYVTDEEPMNINEVLARFTPEERERLIFLDGITKSLGGSNIRSAHLIASEKVAKFIIARASHSVMPTYYGLAVAHAAYEMGFAEASQPLMDPINASRKALGTFLQANNFQHIIGKGYYAFINVGEWVRKGNFASSIELGEHIAQNHGAAFVPGAFFSADGADWLRFSYATPAERTLGAANRLLEGLNAL